MWNNFFRILLLALCCAPPAFAQITNPLAPTTGTINNLVIFIRFSDQPEFAQTLSYYQGAFNTASNSLKNFYLENSYGAVTVDSTFYPTSGGALVSYQDAHPVNYYKAYNASTNPIGYQSGQSTAREAALVNNALAWIDSQVPGGLNLDSDNDGYVDHITFEVYSSTANPAPVLFYSRATYDSSGTVTFRGKQVGSYTWITGAQDAPNTGLALGSVEIHEMGHSFGYPDLRGFNSRQPVGDMDVMATSRVVHSGAWMKYKFTGWIANIPEITNYGNYPLNNLTLPTNNAYKLAIPNSSEFLILEYRTWTGPFEGNGLFTRGLCVTRVNEAQGMWGNLDAGPNYLYYFRKDGTLANDGVGNAWQACLSAETGRVQFNDQSNPACFLSDGSPCGISITNIGSAAGASISFTVTAPGAVPVTRSITGILALGNGTRVGGATVALAGDASGSTTTDSLGNYTLVVDDGGNYTVTPSKTDYSFSPAQQSFTNVTSNQIQDFTATFSANTLSGTVTWGGAALTGVTVVCNGGCTPQQTTTDANGAYAFAVSTGGPYVVFLSGLTSFYSFPSSRTFSFVGSSQSQNFTVQAISTTALSASSGSSASLEDVTFTATVTGSVPSGSVTFSSGGENLCTDAALTSGQAQCATTSLAVGTHSVSAIYSGDNRNSNSLSNILTHVVTQATGNPNPPPPPDPNPPPPAASQTIGTVTFTPGSLIVGGNALVSASATSGLAVSFASITTDICTVSGGSVHGIGIGTCSIVASQSGNANYTPAQALTRNITVLPQTSPGAPPVVEPEAPTVSQPLTTTAPGSALLIPGNTNVVVITGSAGASLSHDIDDTTGFSTFAVDSGEISLPAGSFDTSELSDGVIYSGETVRFDNAGHVTEVHLGSLAGAGSAGDPLTIAVPGNLMLGLVFPDMNQGLPRLDGATLLDGFTAVVAQATGLSFTAPGQNALGMLSFPFNGGSIRAMPVGTILVDTSRSDSLVIAGNTMQVISEGFVTTVAPSVGDLEDFATHLAALGAGSTATIQPDGTIQAAIAGAIYVLQPGWLAVPTTNAPGIRDRSDGFLDYVDAAGNRQVLYPAFADLAQLTATFRALDPGLAVVARGNGVFIATLNGLNLTLVPDYVLIPIPTAHASDAWWRDPNGKVFIQYSEGWAQGFGVK